LPYTCNATQANDITCIQASCQATLYTVAYRRTTESRQKDDFVYANQVKGLNRGQYCLRGRDTSRQCLKCKLQL